MNSERTGNANNRTAINLAIELTAASAELASEIRRYGDSGSSELSAEESDLVAQAAQRIQTILTELVDMAGLSDSPGAVSATSSEILEERPLSEDAPQVYCEVCDEPIPPGRIKAVPGVRTCVACAEDSESPTPTPAVFISDSDISRYQKKRARDLEDEESKGRAPRAVRKQAKRKWWKKKGAKKKSNRR